jgi:hypothetical protein
MKKKKRSTTIVSVAQSNTDNKDDAANNQVDESIKVNTTDKYEDKTNMVIHSQVL